jgi:hypothetical protein
MTFHPCTTLAFLPTVLHFYASPALGKLARSLLPFSTGHICALPNTTLTLILATCVVHNDAAPVLDLIGKMG